MTHVVVHVTNHHTGFDYSCLMDEAKANRLITGDLRGAALAKGLWAQVMLEAQILWTCRSCGHQTTILSEVCMGCRTEDLWQGQTPTKPIEKGLS